ncbi:GAF domain-containing protein [Marivirga sp. S37H4]|uniref:GAF domain-containing protein n=1 Tax=Marivirga aurantiaca TaxID=2802615 RepID=A0A934WXM3_9BACT|nr:GAF domain-containing protein [Marivirga aurantiaca]MBK6264786.1 GAF domain-containing protein [Marivirga aurantiaca]
MTFKDIPIRKKFILAFSSLLLPALLGGFLVYNYFYKVHLFQELKSEMAEVMMELDKSQKIEKEFLLYGWKEISFLENGLSEMTQSFSDKIQLVQKKLNAQAAKSIVVESQFENEIHSLNSSVSEYERTFNELRLMLLKRGFKDHGLEGEMRSYAHELQLCVSPAEKVYAFSLRRHEKDFALRKDQNYVKKLHEASNAFINFIELASIEEYPHMTESYKVETIESIEAYKNHFDRIVQAEIVIGLNQHEGLLSDLENKLASTLPKLNSLYEKINLKNEQLQRSAAIVTFVTILLLLMSVVGLVYLLRKTVSKPIIHLDNIVKKVLSGDAMAGSYLDMESKDEIGSLSRNFQLMLSNLNSNLKQIKEKNSVLENKAIQDASLNWSIKGLSKFSDLMKAQNNDIKSFSFLMIVEIVKYISANQGAFFVISEDEEALELQGCYAYERRKSTNKRIGKGEGLVGQAWLDADHIYLTEIPDSYINIRSGLGGSSPRSILVMPVKYNEKVIGMFEVASFKLFSENEISFLSELSERIGATLNALKMQIHTRNLLKNSRQLTEQLQSQEEQMRRKMDKLLESQEEVSRANKELNDSLYEVRKDFFLLNQILAKVYDGIIIINQHYEIVTVNEYVKETLHYQDKDLYGNSPELIIKKSVNKVLKGLEDNPEFLEAGLSERKSCKIMDRYGKIDDAYFVVSQITCKNEVYYSIMFNKQLNKNNVLKSV